jgi:hypothetical protein
MPSRSDNFRTIAGAHSIENEIGKISRGPRPVVVGPSAKLRTSHGPDRDEERRE